MNMQLTLSVWRIVSSMTCQVSRLLRNAVMVAAAAPMAELSTRLVTPIRKRPVIKKKMSRGMMPAPSSRNFSPQLICCRSFGGNGGPRCGWIQHRMPM